MTVAEPRMGRRLVLAVLVILVCTAGPCLASRILHQSDAAAAPAVPALTADLSAAAPASTVSNIQLNAPGTSNLLNAPALAPASGPLPAGIVSLQVKKGGDYAEKAAQMNEQMAKADGSPQVRTPVRARLPSPSRHRPRRELVHLGAGTPINSPSIGSCTHQVRSNIRTNRDASGMSHAHITPYHAAQWRRPICPSNKCLSVLCPIVQL